jgi:hypothetical protein
VNNGQCQVKVVHKRPLEGSSTTSLKLIGIIKELGFADVLSCWNKN